MFFLQTVLRDSVSVTKPAVPRLYIIREPEQRFLFGGQQRRLQQRCLGTKRLPRAGATEATPGRAGEQRWTSWTSWTSCSNVHQDIADGWTSRQNAAMCIKTSAWPRSSQQKKLAGNNVSPGREVMSQAGPEGEETLICRRAARRGVSAHFPSQTGHTGGDYNAGSDKGTN